MLKSVIYTYLNPKIALMGAGCVKDIGKYAKELGGTFPLWLRPQQMRLLLNP